MQKKESFSRSIIVILSAALVVSAPNAVAQEPTQDTQELRDQTREDILDAYELLAMHHPGMYNPFDPGFAERLEDGKREALLEAQAADTQADRMLAVQAINNALADGHAQVTIAYNGGMGYRPGFEAAWRGDALYVTSSSQATPRRGAKLISCDGEPATDLIEKEVFRAFGRPKEAGQWWQMAGSFFRRGDHSTKPYPQACSFLSPEGSVEAVQLRWERPSLEEFKARLEAAARPDPLGMTHTENGLRWITLSSFSPGPDGVAAYDQIFSDLRAQSDALEDARAIVLDLRGNKGGSSTWSRRIAEHLWGREAVAWAMADYFRDTEVWYLADEGNLAYFAGLGTKLRERGLPEEIADWADEMHVSLSAANAEGGIFYKQLYGMELLAQSQPASPRSLPPVYVIIDGGCVSACLDAVDTFTRFEGVKLVGAPTSADTEYLETRSEPLPSGRGRVVLPTKIWVKRPRGSGEVYLPDLLVTDLDWTTETMVEHILRDLDGG